MRSDKWSAPKRARYRRMILRRRPWLKSTGPRTAIGKRRSAQNARQHGLKSREYALVASYLRSVGSLADRATP
jgi:hypothetical protein